MENCLSNRNWLAAQLSVLKYASSTTTIPKQSQDKTHLAQTYVHLMPHLFGENGSITQVSVRACGPRNSMKTRVSHHMFSTAYPTFSTLCASCLPYVVPMSSRRFFAN